MYIERERYMYLRNCNSMEDLHRGVYHARAASAVSRLEALWIT